MIERCECRREMSLRTFYLGVKRTALRLSSFNLMECYLKNAKNRISTSLGADIPSAFSVYKSRNFHLGSQINLLFWEEKNMAIFKGAGVAIVTPMKENGAVNFEKLEELVEFQIANETDAIIACGTTGESATLPIEEHLKVIEVCIEVAKKRVPVIAGAGSNSTASAIYTSTQSEKLGADGLLLVTPYYNKATQKGLIAHFTAIADAVKIPAILYNVGSRTGINMAPATTAKLVKEVENIVGIKEASGNISQVAEIMNLTDGNIDLYSGNDDQIVPILSLGGIGVISVLSNVAPKETHDIVAKFLAGDVAGSRELQLKYLPLIKALFSEVNPIPVKKALNLMGMEAGTLRLPLTDMEPENAKLLEAELKGAGLL